MVLALIVDTDDVRVREPCGCLGFPMKPADKFGVVGEVRFHHLEGDVALQSGVDGAINARHTAHCDLFEHGVAAVDDLADQLIWSHRVHRQSLRFLFFVARADRTQRPHPRNAPEPEPAGRAGSGEHARPG